MIVSDSDTLTYLLHRVGEKQLTSKRRIIRKALEGNVDSANFLQTFGNSNITAYVGFIDLAGFSTFVQGQSPENIGAYLQPFLEKTINILSNRSALIDKMIGDEIMFVLPETEEENNPHEILLLGQIMGGLHDLAFELKSNYKYRIGLSYGKVNVFHLKGEKYSEWSIVGEPVHVAKRLNGLKELKFPNPVCGAFGLSLSKQSFETVTVQMQHKLEIIAGFASRFTHNIIPDPKDLKGIGKVLWAYLRSRE
ncbi:MAG: hypothetical protein ISS16_12080 [Ignavibacteria bacterium]|nr:hypothetical protein [Ignavibacteria bacterium]